MTAPIAKVPWAPLEPSTLPLEQTRFFQEVLTDERDKQKSERNVRLYRLLNNAYFPFYLPGRYHSMDVVALASKAKKLGYYWAHAAHFLITNQLHGVTFWELSNTCCRERELNSLIDTLPFLSDKMKSDLFMDGLEECKSAAEFLLDPWVLMQLPWHPVLILQWTAGVLVEIYALRLEMVELYRWPVPHNMTTTIIKLFRLFVDLPAYLFQSCIQYLAIHLAYTSRTACYNDVKTFMGIVAQNLVPMIEFMTSGKARDVVRALRRMSRGASVHKDGHTCGTSTIQYHYKDWELTYNCVFSDNFWKVGKAEQAMGMDITQTQVRETIKKAFEMNTLHGTEGFIGEENSRWLKDMKAKYGSRIEPQKILDLLDHKFEKGVFTGATTEELLSGINVHLDYFTKCYYRIKELKANVEGGLRAEDVGVVYNVLCQRTKYKIADVEGAMIAKLLGYCQMDGNSKVRLHAVDAEGPPLTFPEINEILLKVKEQRPQWKHVKNWIPHPCRTKVNKDEIFPNMNGGPKKVAESFELRIKKIVFNMLVEQEDLGTPNTAKFNPDCQFVQYILPCFAASFLEFSDTPEVQPEHTENYARIVHELVKGFEVEPFKVTNMDGPFPGGFSPYLMCENLVFAMVWQHDLLKNSLNMALGNSTQSKLVVEQIEQNFFKVMLDYKKSPTRASLNGVDDFTDHFLLWNIQVYRLFNRILKAIEKAVPEYLKDLKPMEKYLTANIALQDYKYRFINKPDMPCRYPSASLVEKSPVYDLMLSYAMKEARKELGLKLPPKDTTEDKDTKNPIILECCSLSLDQIAGLLIYYCLKPKVGSGVCENEGDLRVPMDKVEETFFAWRANDRVKLKLLLAEMFTLDGTDQSVVTYEFAKTKAPWLYRAVLSEVEDGRVKMYKPGELTLLPLRHCRWCGLVDSAKLRMCTECADEMHHPDKSWFCGDECEKLALDAVHNEEHARRIIIGLHIEKPRLEFEQKEEAEEQGAVKAVAQKKKKKRSGRAKK